MSIYSHPLYRRTSLDPPSFPSTILFLPIAILPQSRVSHQNDHKIIQVNSQSFHNKSLPPLSSPLTVHPEPSSGHYPPSAVLQSHLTLSRKHLSPRPAMHAFLKATRWCPNPPDVEPRSPGLTLFMYSLSRSWSACRTALHSATILSRRSSRVQDESAMRAAPLMMLSSLSSRDGRNLASLNVMGSRIILF